MSDTTKSVDDELEIYDSTHYIENPTVGDYKLVVNSMWDFGSRSVCFGYAGDTLISYDVKVCTKVEDSFVVGSNPPKPCKVTTWEEADITKELVAALEKQGYSVSGGYNQIRQEFRTKGGTDAPSN